MTPTAASENICGSRDASLPHEIGKPNRGDDAGIFATDECLRDSRRKKKNRANDAEEGEEEEVWKDVSAERGAISPLRRSLLSRSPPLPPPKGEYGDADARARFFGLCKKQHKQSARFEERRRASLLRGR